MFHFVSFQPGTACRLLVLGALPLLSLIPNAFGAPGKVYLIVGSDTAIWNGPGTVDVVSRHPYYPQDFYTDPSSPSYVVMDPAWRKQFQDSYGHPVKFTWWIMGGNIYRDATNQNVPIPNTMVMYLMNKYHGSAMRSAGDEISLHYHTFLWSDYNADGRFYWNQARTFDDCRDDFDFTLAQYLLEEEVFPVSFRSGWHYMDNAWQQYLDQLLPFSVHDDWPYYRAWYTNEPINNVEDWSRSSSSFVPFHPATNDYQVAGTGKGWNLRSIKMQNMLQADMNTIFSRASNGVDQAVCVWNHLPENFVANFARIASLAQTAASNSPGVLFRYCTAIEGMQRWLGITNQTPPILDVTQQAQGQAVSLTIRSSSPLFQPRPFVALRDAFQRYTNLTAACVSAGEQTWTVTLPVPGNLLAKVGIAVTDLDGNLATRILRFLPDDRYLDNLDPEYAELQGAWHSTSSTAWGTNARIAQLSATNAAEVRWFLPVPRSGFYTLGVQVPAVTNAARNIHFTFSTGDSNTASIFFPSALPTNRWLTLDTRFLDQARSNFLGMTVSGTGQAGAWVAADVVRLMPVPDTDPPFNHLLIQPSSRGFRLLFAGAPGQACDVERSADPTNGWTTLATALVAENGIAEYEDTSPLPSAAFYRVRRAAP